MVFGSVTRVHGSMFTYVLSRCISNGSHRVAGQLLFDLGHCIDNKRVQAKGPQQSICCTKSYHGLREHTRVDEALQRLVFALWPRLLEVLHAPAKDQYLLP